MPDDRLQALSAWVAEATNDRRCTIRPASADASFRRYYRVYTRDRGSFIAMDAPPQNEDCRPYVRIARALRAIGLNAPEILAEDIERGFLLITDLGERLYLDALDDTSADELYRDAIEALIRLQRGSDFAWLPLYDAALLRREMELFREWYLGRHLGVDLDAHRHAVLDDAFERLATAALGQPYVPVHRDYHSRNLLVTETNNPGILDFQDAVRGPVSYDLVSLLRDCYIAWPRERVETWLRQYRAAAAGAGIAVGHEEREFVRWFDWMGVQRHLKASGIFARLNYRDRKPGYLRDIPRVLAYVTDVATRYSELEPMARLLEDVRATGDLRAEPS